jgi:glycosyltransferase involved in cell wall biosynthesis
MRYSIITPTILRPSLIKACDSVDQQVGTDWEHIVMVDGDSNPEIERRIEHSRRLIFHCAEKHGNWGNVCRHNAWEYAKGDYILYLDDDSYLADPQVLETLKVITKPWAIFPIEKTWLCGLYFHCPPMKGFTDAGNMIIRREIGQYPDLPVYEADGILAERLWQTASMQALLGRPLMIKPTK